MARDGEVGTTLWANGVHPARYVGNGRHVRLDFQQASTASGRLREGRGRISPSPLQEGSSALMAVDGGYLWIFSSSHGTGRPSYIHRSTKPWSIDEFERILVTNFSYTQPWHVPGDGFLFLHTR